jgi:hypothetical protein
MEKVKQVVASIDEFIAKYPSVTQFGRYSSHILSLVVLANDQSVPREFSVALRTTSTQSSDC